MQFQVPQFIEVEDRIFGPLTFKQFVYMGGGLGLAYIAWRILPIFIAGPLIVVSVGFAAALAFMQYNGRPFILALESAFFYAVRGKLYLWNNERKMTAAAQTKTVSPEITQLHVPKLSESKLHDLAWSLDIQEKIAAGMRREEAQAEKEASLPAMMRLAKDARIT